MKKGSKHSPETIEKLREARSKQVMPPDVGKKAVETRRKNGTLSPSTETKKKMSEAQKNLSPEKRERINYGIRYNRYTLEYAKKLSESKLGEKNHTAKLTAEKVIKIRHLWATGNYSCAVLGEMFGASRQAVTDVVYERTWKHLL